MAEYFPLLERAVSGLQNSTPEARNALYERARTALLGQLRLSDPPVPESDIERESVALDEAIARVEANAKARQESSGSPETDSPPTAPSAPVAGPPSPQASVGPVSSPGLPSGVRPAIPPRSPRPAAERSPSGGAAPAASSPPARERPAYPFRNLDPGAVATRPVPPVRPNVPIGEDAQTSAPRLGAAVRPTDSAASSPVGMMVGDPVVDRSSARTAPPDRTPAAENGRDRQTSEPLPTPVGDDGAQPGRESRNRGQETSAVRPAAPVRTEHEPRSRAGLYAVLLTLLLLVGGVGVAAYILRDRPEQIVAARPDVTVADDSPNKIVNRAEPPPSGTPPLGRAADQPAASVPTQSSPPSDTATLPAPIPMGSERASRGPQASTADNTPADQSGPDSTTSPSSSATADPAIGVSQRAGMLVDAPEEPQKVKTYAGSVVWRMESISAGQGQPLSNAVRADIEIPDAKVAMSMVLKRNVEPQFPASHTIEFHFVEQPGNTLGPVKQINVPELRRDDSSPAGDALAGVPVSITDDYFLVGLSRGGAEASNLQLLTQRNWIDISIMLNSGKIAKVAFEKGAPGQKILEDAIASWR